MDRRSFLKSLAGSSATALIAVTPPAPAPPRRILLQHSPLAGFQFYEGEALWPMLWTGAGLRLTREPDNRHDARAVAVRFAGRRLGYVPRRENTAIAQLMDRGERLDAAIVGLQRASDPWERVRMQIDLVLS